ncbi:MAG: AmmeMemoRadiSam system radical SAM enzyme [Bacteroidia bacterium]|nr:AmmeMemoRadiSam system radical SAM enzyme [Bacteroidia bacterium]
MEPNEYSREAKYYQLTDKGIKCALCFRNCLLKPGELSICHTRLAGQSKLHTIAYGNPCSMQIDPIEKKPLYHFYPGIQLFSIATAGCNLSCINCQNHQISQVSPGDLTNYRLMPEDVINLCLKNNYRSIAYTYTEPTVYYEYMYDTAKLARSHGIRNVMISNGMINEIPLKELCQFQDAANIDLKCFDDQLYFKMSKGRLQPVLNTLKILRDEGVWIELTNLVIPGMTDNMEMIRRMCRWLTDNKLNHFPLHFSRFYPAYKSTRTGVTPAETLEQARDIALSEGIEYIYIGNVAGHKAQNTYCPGCGKLIIEREGYSISLKHFNSGRCSFCSRTIHGVWE